MSNFDLANLDSESIALLYLSGELPAAQLSAVEEMLSRDLVLRGQVERLRATQDAVNDALTSADAASLPASSEAAAVRKVGRAMTDWKVNWLARPAEKEKREFHWRSMVPVAVAAGIVITIGMYMWWSSVDGTDMRGNGNQQFAEADSGDAPNMDNTPASDNGETPQIADADADADVATILFINTPDQNELASAEQDMSALRFLSEQSHENGAP